MSPSARFDGAVGERDAIAIDRNTADVMFLKGQIMAEISGHFHENAMRAACHLRADAISGEEDNMGFQNKLRWGGGIKIVREDGAWATMRRSGRYWPHTAG